MTINCLQARSPGIYKGHYLQELARRYNGGFMSDILIPERPDWCFEEEGDAPNNAESNRTQNSTKRKYQGFQNQV